MKETSQFVQSLAAAVSVLASFSACGTVRISSPWALGYKTLVKNRGWVW